MNEPVLVYLRSNLIAVHAQSLTIFCVLGILDKGREESGARGGGGAPGGQAPVLASSRSTASMAAAHEPARGSGGASVPLDPLDWLSTSSMQVLTTAAIPSAQAPLDWLSAPAWVAAAAAAAAAAAEAAAAACE